VEKWKRLSEKMFIQHKNIYFKQKNV